MPVLPHLDTSPALGDRVHLHPSCRGIGDVMIGADSSVWCNTVLPAT